MAPHGFPAHTKVTPEAAKGGLWQLGLSSNIWNWIYMDIP